MANRISLSELYGRLGITWQSGRGLAYLCSNAHGKINRWACFKPQISSSAKALTLAQRKAGNFGLRPTNMFDSVRTLIGSFNDGVEGDFTYDGAPRVDIDRMRLSDFVGYNHAATPPWWRMDAEIERTIPEDGVLNLRLTLMQPADDSGSVRFKDMLMDGNENFAKWHPGAVVFDSFDTLAVTSVQTVEETKGDCVLDFGALGSEYAGTYTVIPIMARDEIDPDDLEGTNSIVQIGGGSTLVIKDWQPAQGISVRAEFHGASNNVLSVSLTLYNDDDAAFTFRDVTVLVAESNSGKYSLTLGVPGDIIVDGRSSRTMTYTYESSSVSGTSWGNLRFVQVRCSSPEVDDTDWTFISQGPVTVSDEPEDEVSDAPLG